MANRPDRRKQKSRQAILSAFRTLLTQKRYSDITVQEIIDLADVGRSTFYAHFETKDTLLAELCADISAHVVAPHQHAESSHDFSGVKPDAATVVTHIFYHLRDDHRNLVMMLKGSSRALFCRLMPPPKGTAGDTRMLPQRRMCSFMVSRPFSGMTRSVVELLLCDALALQPAHQKLQGLHHMGADVAADEHQHDVVPQAQLSLIEPDPHMIDARQGPGLRHGGVNFFPVVGKEHSAHGRGVLGALPHQSPGSLPDDAVVRQVHAAVRRV